MKIYGHTDVRLMNGGRKKWIAEGRELTTEVPQLERTSYTAGEPDFSLRAFLPEVQRASEAGSHGLVDVRSPDEYTGEILAPPGLPETCQRGGHIPGAQSIPWGLACNEDGTFKAADDLKALYEGKGVTPDKPAVAYCRIDETIGADQPLQQGAKRDEAVRVRHFFAATLAVMLLALPWSSWAQGKYELDVPLGLDADRMEIPKDNPLTSAKIELGKLLFFDPRLSVDDTVACASCHSPQFGFSNGLVTAIGVKGQRGGRSAPVTINRAFSTLQFWDGRAASLEEQALGPIQASIEMGHDLKAVVAKLNGIRGYRELFQKAFGTDVTSEGIAKAIASFERTLLSANSPFDRYEAGTKSAFSPAARRGLEIFRTKANCTSCHVGFNFTDEDFHNIGVGMDKSKPDLGRFAVTKKEADRGAFKTPTLRDVARSGPYMHDGNLKTLEQVIDYYDRGGMENPWLDEKIKPLGLTDQEKQDLLAILKALTGAPIVVQVPSLPE